MPPLPLGNRTKMESTAALLPQQGSRAMGFGTDCGRKRHITNVFKATDDCSSMVLFVSNMRANHSTHFHPPLRFMF